MLFFIISFPCVQFLLFSIKHINLYRISLTTSDFTISFVIPRYLLTRMTSSISVSSFSVSPSKSSASFSTSPVFSYFQVKNGLP